MLPVGAVEPIPDSQQGPLALKIIDDYHGKRPVEPVRKLRIVYFTPADREPLPRYEERMEAIFEDIRGFYRDEMQRHGFGPKTFTLERDGNGKFIIHLVKGTKSKDACTNAWDSRHRVIGADCRPVFKEAGISFDRETIAIVCNLADWDEQTHIFRHPTPYTGQWTQQGGLCWLMDSPILDIDFLLKTEPVVKDFQFGNVPMGKRNSMFIGSFAHEMGHAFGLPHSGRRWDEVASSGASIMGAGNLVYHDERRNEDRGASLTLASAMRLAGRPSFNGSDKGIDETPRLQRCDLALSTNVTSPALVGRRATFRLEGTVRGSPPVYGVVAYFDSLHDGGYRAPAATSVPDADGKFAIEVSDLAPCEKGDLRIAFCHVNGGVSQRRLDFSVAKDTRK